MKIKAAVCDNERFALDAICEAVRKAFIQQGVDLDIYAYSNLMELYRAIAEQSFDLLLLDIDMGQRTNGIDFAKELHKRKIQPEILFISNREDLVFEAFQVQPLGFIRKNCFFKDLSRYVPLVKEKLSRPITSEQIAIDIDGGTVTICLSEIVYVEGALKKQLFHLNTAGSPLKVQLTMRELEAILCTHQFVRIHNGYIVNYAYISRVNNDEIVLKNGISLPISRGRRQETRRGYFEYLKSIGALNC